MLSDRVSQTTNASWLHLSFAFEGLFRAYNDKELSVMSSEVFTYPSSWKSSVEIMCSACQLISWLDIEEHLDNTLSSDWKSCNIH